MPQSHTLYSNESTLGRKKITFVGLEWGEKRKGENVLSVYFMTFCITVHKNDHTGTDPNNLA